MMDILLAVVICSLLTIPFYSIFKIIYNKFIAVNMVLAVPLGLGVVGLLSVYTVGIVIPFILSTVVLIILPFLIINGFRKTILFGLFTTISLGMNGLYNYKYTYKVEMLEVTKIVSEVQVRRGLDGFSYQMYFTNGLKCNHLYGRKVGDKVRVKWTEVGYMKFVKHCS